MEPLSEEAVRVLGCLVEKESTVPDAYPLTLNALRSACNQTSSRDPVVDYDDLTIQRCLDELKHGGWVRFVHPSHGERATRFRHVADEKLDLDRASLAVLSLLALRGPQTSGELRTRSGRQHHFASPTEVDAVLASLLVRDDPLVVELPRLAGHHGTRWMHLLAGPVDVGALTTPSTPSGRAAGGGGVGDRVAVLEAEVASLRSRLAALEDALGVAVPPEAPEPSAGSAGFSPGLWSSSPDLDPEA